MLFTKYGEYDLSNDKDLHAYIAQNLGLPSDHLGHISSVFKRLSQANKRIKELEKGFKEQPHQSIYEELHEQIAQLRTVIACYENGEDAGSHILKLQSQNTKLIEALKEAKEKYLIEQARDVGMGIVEFIDSTLSEIGGEDE